MIFSEDRRPPRIKSEGRLFRDHVPAISSSRHCGALSTSQHHWHPASRDHSGATAMTPQERQLVDELFDRLAQLENAPRDPDAERAIIDGLRRSPTATYALVQTVLVQDEALKRANARIQELESGGQQPEEPPR